MATLIPLEDRLQLRIDDNGNTRTRSWGNVKPNVTDAVLHDFAEALDGLTQESVEKIIRVKIGELQGA